MTQFNINKEAQELAQDAWDSALEYGLTDDIQELQEYAQERLHQSCDGHEMAIYTYKAIQFCADVDTSDGEQWLDDCGGSHAGVHGWRDDFHAGFRCIYCRNCS